MGGMALLDGFTREAVTAFAAALERAYELYVRVIFELENEPPSFEVAKQSGWDYSVKEVFEPTWRLLRRQSERQIGAFTALFALHERVEPLLPPAKWVEFRNDCTHKGMIPSTTKTVEYGAVVMNIIEQIRTITQKKYGDALDRVTMNHLSQRLGGARGTTMTMSIPSMIRWANPSDSSLEERLSELQKYRQWQWKT